MKTLRFSYTPADAVDANAFRQVLQNFETDAGIKITLDALDIKTARETLTRFILEGTVVDVSQIGSTWLRGLVDMSALRPFSLKEIDILGGEDSYLPAIWETTRLPDVIERYAIPWLADARIVCYRRDLLEKAKVDELTAFTSTQAFDETLRKLEAAGIIIPWVVPNQYSWRSLHNIASWIWANGANFMSRNGESVTFAEPKALAAFAAYFALGRFMPTKVRGLNQLQAEKLFFDGHAAVTISGPNVLCMRPELLARVGFALPLEKPFVGGSHLVIAKASSKSEIALKFIQVLVSNEAQQSFWGGLLPVKKAVLTSFTHSRSFEGEFARFVLSAMTLGQSFPPLYLWDLVEARLVEIIPWLWEKSFVSSVDDFATILSRELGTLAHRLNMTLQYR